jgi:hypothetical protein
MANGWTATSPRTTAPRSVPRRRYVARGRAGPASAGNRPVSSSRIRGLRLNKLVTSSRVDGVPGRTGRPSSSTDSAYCTGSLSRADAANILPTHLPP